MLGRINVNVNDFGASRKFRDIARDAVIKSRSGGNQQIGFINRLICVARAVHPRHPQKERIVAGKFA